MGNGLFFSGIEKDEREIKNLIKEERQSKIKILDQKLPCSFPRKKKENIYIFSLWGKIFIS